MARKKGLSEELGLVDAISLNGTGTLHTWLLVQLRPGGWWAKRNLAGMLYQQELSILCGSHICLHVSLPTAPVHLPEECTSISHCLVVFCTGHCPQIGTYWTHGLLSLLLPVLQ